MNLSDYLQEAIFQEKEKFAPLYQLLWNSLEEDGYVAPDDPDTEVDCVFKAIAIRNLIGEFVYRMYDEVNETGINDIRQHLATLGIDDDAIVDYCYENPEIDADDEDDDITVYNALSFITGEVADKLLELFSFEDLFDYFFTATYDFEQDFVFAFEDADELMAFADANQDKLDSYKDEYESVLSWIENGMVV